VIKGGNIFLVQKLAKNCSFVGWRIIAQQEKSREKNAAGRNGECASGDDSLFLYKIMHLLFFFLVRILWALRPENRKNYQHGLDAGNLKFQFIRPRGCLTNPSRTLLLCFGVISKTPDLISRKNVVKKFCLHRPSR
jgi:hypothetical protein